MSEFVQHRFSDQRGKSGVRWSRTERLQGKGKQIQKLRAVHREVLRLNSLGMRYKEIAERVGLHPAYITTIINSAPALAQTEVMQAEYDADTRAVKDVVNRGAILGVQYLEKIVDPESDESRMAAPALKVKVAQDFLDREGSAPRIARADGKQLHVHATTEDLRRIKELAKGRDGDGDMVTIEQVQDQLWYIERVKASLLG